MFSLLFIFLFIENYSVYGIKMKYISLIFILLFSIKSHSLKSSPLPLIIFVIYSFILNAFISFNTGSITNLIIYIYDSTTKSLKNIAINP